MENQPSGYFQDDNGNQSSMRVMCFMSLIAAIAAAALMFFKPPTEAFNGLYIFTVFMVGAFAPKAIQKFAEILPMVMGKKQ
jgi:hypothetical protein